MAALPMIASVIASVASMATSIYSATKDTPEPAKPKPGLNPAVAVAQNQQRAAAAGRSSTNITGQKLGQVGTV